MALLLQAHADVGGDIVSAGGTGTYDLNTWATEIQAGSYALMDTAYAKLGAAVPAGPDRARHGDLGQPGAAGRWPTAGSRRSAWTTATRRIAGGATVWFCSDEHVDVLRRRTRRCHRSATGCASCPRTSTRPCACHERMHVVDGEEVVDAGRSTSAAGDPAEMLSGPQRTAVTAVSAAPAGPIRSGGSGCSPASRS